MRDRQAEDADEFLFREYARRLSVSPSSFFQAEDDLQGLQDLICRRLAPQLFAYAKSKGVPFVDVTDTIGYVLILLSTESLASRVSDAKTSPFGLAYTDIVRSLNKQTDRTYQEEYLGVDRQRHTRTRWVDHVDIDTPGLDVTAPSATYDVEMSLTEAIDRSATVLEGLSTRRVAAHVFSAVEWLTMNWPERRSYEHHTLDSAFDALPQLHGLEVKAIAAATWGARNRTAETSLVSGFLRVEAFNPAVSSSHRQVLHQYRCQVFRPGLAVAA